MTNLDSILKSRDLCHKGLQGFPCGSAGKDSACNAGDLGLDPWMGKIPWRRKRLPTPVYWPGEFHGLQSMGSQRVGHYWATFTFTFHIVKAMLFTVVMYEWENWTIKKAECRRIDAFKTLESPLEYKEIKPVSHWKYWCWSWSSNTLATWCKEPTHLKRCWCWEKWRQEEKGATGNGMVGWHQRLNGHEFEQVPEDGEGQGSAAAVHGVTNSWTWLNDWTTTTKVLLMLL